MDGNSRMEPTDYSSDRAARWWVCLCKMLRIAASSALLSTAAIGCGDDAPVGIPVPCIGKCVPYVDVNLEDLVLTPGDTVQLRAEARAADGTLSDVRWIASSPSVNVDTAGLVKAESLGKTGVWARALIDIEKFGVSEIWVVDPDSGVQPFLTGFRDARTGRFLPRWRGFTGYDSITVTVSYVLGRSVVTSGEPHVIVQVRRPGTGVVVRSHPLPLTVRGRGAFVDLRLHITERDASGQRLLPSGSYDLFVLLPLADGRILGMETGYGVTF